VTVIRRHLGLVEWSVADRGRQYLLLADEELILVHNRGIDQLRSTASRRRMQEKVDVSAPTVQPSTLEGDRAVLVVENMPPVPEGKTYQIWVIEDDVPKPSGLFKPRRDSVAAVVEHPLGGGDVIAVTVEPEGGSPQPTSDPMLAAEVRT
jgi:hypothetical protein